MDANQEDGESIDHYERCIEFLGVQDAPVPSRAEVRQMKTAGWWPDEETPIDSHKAGVRNAVAHAKLVTKNPNDPPFSIDLTATAAQFVRLNFRVIESFPTLVWKLGTPQNEISISVLIYRSGSLLITGVCHKYQLLAAVNALIDIFENVMGYPPLRIEEGFRICNMVISGELPGDVRVSALKSNYPSFVELQRQQFPGASLTFHTNNQDCKSRRIVALSFDSPYFVVVGLHDQTGYNAAIFPICYMLWRSRLINRRRIAPTLADISTPPRQRPRYTQEPENSESGASASSTEEEN